LLVLALANVLTCKLSLLEGERAPIYGDGRLHGVEQLAGALQERPSASLKVGQR